MKNSQKRIEKDSLGEIKVPKNAYYGGFSVRAQSNFQISGINSPEIFQKALGTVKLAAAMTNTELGLISKKNSSAIQKACKEFIDGKFKNEFTLDVFQAGAGTSYNMSSNEIISNRANEILKSPKGQYKHVHPNNHVNMAQSTNDVIPTTTRVATLLAMPALIQEIKKFEKALTEKSKKHANTLKVGRTHLQDAVPITFGQEFDAYKEAIQKSREFIEERTKDLKILSIGGTAVGTGINTDPQYQSKMVSNISKLTNTKFKPGKNLTELANNMNSFMNFSASLRSLAINLLNISNDLKIMGTGPRAGLYEVTLPPVQPGSSIMPGKVNPSIPECMDMICCQVTGNDRTIEMTAQKSNFELNVMCPIIMYNILQSMEILTNGLKMFRERCIEGLTINKKRTEELFNKSTCTATALAPYIGYQLTADVVKSALKKNISIEQEVLERGIYNKTEIKEILSIKTTTSPSKLKKSLIRK